MDVSRASNLSCRPAPSTADLVSESTSKEDEKEERKERKGARQGNVQKQRFLLSLFF